MPIKFPIGIGIPCVEEVTYRLPLPPSTNHLYANTKEGAGVPRVKTPEYRTWIKNADSWLRPIPIRRVAGKFTLTLLVDRGAFDLSNRIKAVEDYFQSREIIDNDKLNEELNVKWSLFRTAVPEILCTIRKY